MLLSAALVLAFPGSAAAFGPLSSFGTFGGGAGQLSSPSQIAVAANGDLYIADRGNDRISVFSGDGAFLRSFGESVTEEPNDVALDGEDRVFVADQGNNRIDVFSAAGAFLFAFGKDVGGAGIDVCETSCQPGTADSANGAMAAPAGVAFDGTSVYVADQGNNRIDVFSDAGVFVDSFAGPVSSPRDVIVGSDGKLYVADFGNGRVDVFTKQGTFFESFGSAELSGPVALAIDSAADVFVADQVAQRIERFNPSSGHVGGFPAEPNVAGVGVACQGNVFAVEADTLFAGVERFGEPGTPAPPCVESAAAAPIEVSLVELPSNRFRFAGLVKNRSNGSAVLFVRVPGAGRVLLRGRGFRRLARPAPRAKRVRLPVKPKIPLKRFLKRHGKGRIRVEVTFKPSGGTPRTLEKVIVLRRHRS